MRENKTVEVKTQGTGHAMITRGVSNKARWLGLAALLVCSPVSSLAQTYTTTDLGAGIIAGDINSSGQVVGNPYAFLYGGGTKIDLGTLGGSYSIALGVNNGGQVVGYSRTASEQTHAFLYSSGAMIDLGTLGGADSGAVGINSSGQVVGSSITDRGRQHAFLYSGGTMIDLGTLGGRLNSNAQGINNSGQIVGYSFTASETDAHAFLYSRGTMIDLGPGSATKINNSGQVVGTNGSHAFLYSGGTMFDLDTLGGSYSTPVRINDSGQIVGVSQTADGAYHAFLYSDGTMKDLNNLVTLPAGVQLTSATGINAQGQIVANGSNSHGYLLTPNNSLLTVVNPFVYFAVVNQAPPKLDLSWVLSSPRATSLAADGKSAVTLVYRSKSQMKVTFNLSASGKGLPPGTTVAALDDFAEDYLSSPSPPRGSLQSYQSKDTLPAYGPDAAGDYVFLALLWAPNAMPVHNVYPIVSLNVTATQQGQASPSQASVVLEPPPVLLIHGIWSSADESGFLPGLPGLGPPRFYDWISIRYPHNGIYAVDYGDLSSTEFIDSRIQRRLLSSMTDALAFANDAGLAARTVDVVAHSMGGLVTRYFLSTDGYRGNPALLENPVHKLITIGTPHQGTLLATTLVEKQNQLATAIVFPLVKVLCRAFSFCTLGSVFGATGHKVESGVESLRPDSYQITALSPSNEFAAIVGLAPVNPISSTEDLLNNVINAFLPGLTVASILGGQPNDTIVPVMSQNPQSAEQTDLVAVGGIVHACLIGSCQDKDETHDERVWQQVYYWLTGGTGPAPEGSLISSTTLNALTPAATTPPPVLDLSGYTEVNASNITFLPASGSILTINSPANITAASPARTIIEVLLLQTVTDPMDTPLLYATQAPFRIPFTPTRRGTTSFGAIAVFSDKTYAITNFNYTLQPSGTPYSLNLRNAPVARLTAGTSRPMRVLALYGSGPVDVTQVATYRTRSGSASVFSVSSDGTITANGNGVDLLDVTYGGSTATTLIAAGTCTYALNPSNQIVPNTGGTVAIQVTTQAGCAWTAGGGSAWAPFTQASGAGNGAITLSSAANNTVSTRAFLVTLAGLQVVITQPTTACTYSLSQTQISAPAAGTNGMIAVTTTPSCPVIASGDQNWVMPTPLGSSVAYIVAPNDGASQRSATLTIGTESIPVTQNGTDGEGTDRRHPLAEPHFLR